MIGGVGGVLIISGEEYVLALGNGQCPQRSTLHVEKTCVAGVV